MVLKAGRCQLKKCGKLIRGNKMKLMDSEKYSGRSLIVCIVPALGSNSVGNPNNPYIKHDGTFVPALTREKRRREK